MAIPNDDLTFEIYTLFSSGRLILINKKGVRTELGEVNKGRFAASYSEECVIETMALIKKGIKAAAGQFKKGR